MKIKFTQNPTGKYNLAYSAGEIANVPDEQAKLLVEEGFATPFVDGVETASTEQPAVETASFGLNKKEKKGK